MLLQKPLAYSGGNSLLDLLIVATSHTFVEGAVVMRFESGNVLLDSNEAITHVYFPIDMMISTTTLMKDSSEVEVGSIGCEGMSGVQLVLGVDHVPGRAICQVAGSAARLPALEFLRCFDESAQVRKIMLRYIQAMMNLMEISIACNALHDATARCTRWLLLTHDRVRRDEFGLTQEFLGMMMGVRRATANIVAQDLQKHGAMRYMHGRVRIVDRAELERAACECYRAGIDRYNELLGQVPFRRLKSL